MVEVASRLLVVSKSQRGPGLSEETSFGFQSAEGLSGRALFSVTLSPSCLVA